VKYKFCEQGIKNIDSLYSALNTGNCENDLQINNTKPYKKIQKKIKEGAKLEVKIETQVFF